jgi:shikimate dehydrogenase/3-dehydroquinate dehydratase type I
MKLVVTILEKTFDAAIDAIRRLALDHDAVELRAEELGDIDYGTLRASTEKPLILTHRGRRTDEGTIRSAVAAGIDMIDVEFDQALDRGVIASHADRIVLSHHDYEGMPDVENLIESMRAFGCAHVKLAATPRSMPENLRLLHLLERIPEGLSVIGMEERGLYSRILAPFRGSELAFVAPDVSRSGAPGQIALSTALEIYGPRRQSVHATHVFAIAGDPAGHSLSPAIHNALFREKGADAAYTIASFDTFSEIAGALTAGELRGLSVTAPFKEEAFAFAAASGAAIAEHARACGAVNTLVRRHGGILADNTDVDGFAAILRELCGRDRKSVALAGAGGTARAALVALRRAGMHVTIFNRTAAKATNLASAFDAHAEPLDELTHFDGEIVINALPPSAELNLNLKPGSTYIEAAYGHPRLADRCSQLAANGVQVFDGLDLLRAQSIRQNELFIEAIA